MPDDLGMVLAEVEDRVSRLKPHGRAHLIESHDSGLLRSLMARPELEGTCLTAGDHFLVIMPGAEKRFVKELFKIGYLVTLPEA